MTDDDWTLVAKAYQAMRALLEADGLDDDEIDALFQEAHEHTDANMPMYRRLSDDAREQLVADARRNLLEFVETGDCPRARYRS